MTLSEHRLAAVEIADVTTRYPRTVGRNARLGSHGSGGPNVAVVLHTDSGATGWGLAAARSSASLERFVGRRLDELFDVEKGILDTDAAVLDLALHDLAGVIHNQPVHALLGGQGERAITCYSGAIYFDDLDPEESPRGIDAVLANVAADHALGYRAFKLKIGRGFRWMDAAAGRRRDIEVTRAVHDAYPDVRILVDANNGYSAADFVDYLRAVGDCDLFWVEEPFHEQRDDLRLLRDHLDHTGAGTLIADGEYDPVEAELLDLAADGLLDVLLMDIVSYGFTAWRRVMPELVRRGVQASPHAWGLPRKTRYTANLAAGLGNVVTVEGVPGVTDGVDSSGYQLDEGVLRVPDSPGFGLVLTAPRRRP